MVRAAKFSTALRPVLALAALAATACVDSGLPGENLPLEDARLRPPVYDTYDASLNIEPFHFEGQDWMAAGPAVALSDRLLTSVSTGEREVFALLTDTPPFGRLYVRTADGFTPLAPAPIKGSAPASDSEEHH